MVHANHLSSLRLIGMLAPDGRCKTLDEAGNGYVRAEDCVVFVLDVSSLDFATDILAIVYGSAVRQVRPSRSRIEEVLLTNLTMSNTMRRRYCGLFRPS